MKVQRQVTAFTPLDPHRMIGLRVGSAFEHRYDLQTVEPGWCEPHAIILGLNGEEHTDVSRA